MPSLPFAVLLTTAPWLLLPADDAVLADLALMPMLVGVEAEDDEDDERKKLRARSTASTFRPWRARLLQDPLPSSSFQDPEDPKRPAYRHLDSSDVWDPRSFWFTNRDNIVNQEAIDRWDPLKLINTDRPDFTDVATVVGDGVVQIESGFLRVVRQDDQSRTKIDSGPNVLARVGVGDRFEWRVKWRGWLHEKYTDASGNRGSLDGFSDVELGFKYVLHEQEDLVPMQTIVTRLGVPVGGDQVSSNVLEPGISYIYNWQVRRWWFLRGATGVDVFNQPAPTFRPQGLLSGERDHWLEISQAVSSYFQLSRQVGSFVEWFMFNRHGSVDDHSDHFHNYGLYYYVTPDFQLDGRIGWRFGDHVDQAFWGCGVSMRL